MLNRRVGRISLAVGLVAALLTATSPSSASAFPKPSISGLGAFPSALTSAGGLVTLSGTAANYILCTVSSNRPATVGGTCLPTQILIPPNTGKRAINYRLKVKLAGYPAPRSASAHTTVTVSTAPPIGPGIAPGQEWTLQSGPLCIAVETFGEGGTFTTDNGNAAGTYVDGGDVLSEVTTGAGLSMTATWDNIDQMYVGTATVAMGQVSISLTPGARPGC